MSPALVAASACSRRGPPLLAAPPFPGADVEEDDGVPGAEVVGDGPAHGERGLVGEVDGDGDAAMRGSEGGGGGGVGEEDVGGVGLEGGQRRGMGSRRLHPRRRRRKGRQVNDGVRRGLHRVGAGRDLSRRVLMET